MPKFTISAVIPTKNRPQDLQRAVSSILSQKSPPQQLLIIDQSPGDESRLAVTAMCAAMPDVQLIYVHDPAIAGLAPAKAASLAHAQGGIISFLEDDVVLEPDYFAEIEVGFVGHPEMLGCCGVVAGVGTLPSGYVAFFHLFHRGIFFDPRVGVHGYMSGKGHALRSQLGCWSFLTVTHHPARATFCWSPTCARAIYWLSCVTTGAFRVQRADCELLNVLPCPVPSSILGHCTGMNGKTRFAGRRPYLIAFVSVFSRQ
jgi:glycosyltransferase involved in cell wall biosynthesis